MTASAAPVSALDLLPVLQALPGLYLILSPDLVIVEASDSYLASTFKDRSIIGQSCLDIVPTNLDLPNAAAAANLYSSLQYVLRSRQPHTMAIQRHYVTKSKSQAGSSEEKYWQPCNRPVLDAKGNILYLIHSVADVTDQYKAQLETDKQAQQAQWNLERLELIARAINDVIWDWNLADNSIWWNDGFQVTFGYQKEEIEETVISWSNRIHPDDTERVVARLHQAIDNGSSSWQDEYRFRKADGTYAEILDRGFITRDATGKPLRMIGAMLDMTEKNRVTAELKATANQFSTLLEGIPEIAWVARANGSIYYYNKEWYLYTGHTKPDEGWESVVHPDDFPDLMANWRNSLKTGKEYTQQARLKRASDSQYHWFSIRATPVYNKDKTINAWIGVNTNIQEQKNIQQQLQERDEYVQRMLAQAPIQFAVLKGDTWIIDFATPQFKKLVGGHDIVGKPLKEALPELEQNFFEQVGNVYATGRLYRGNEQPAYLDRKGDGTLELGYFNFTYQPLFNDQHLVEGVMILIVEVTERVVAKQQAEKLTSELQASHDRVTQILDALPHMTFTAKPDGYVEYYSQQWYDYLGTTQEELTGWGWEYFIHPDDIQTTHAKWNHSLATGEPFMIENRWKTKNREDYCWFLVRGVPIRSEEGTITMWVGSHTDIQEQKQMLLALQESTKNFQFLADSMPQLVWTTDPQGFHDYFNKQWVKFTGYTVEDSKGTHMWNNLLHPDDQARSFARWRHSLETGEPYQVEYRFKRAADGEWRWFLGRALPMRDQEGNILRWFGTCTDIEEQKRGEEIMAQTNRELRSINEDLDSFVYTASHDLKLPIINMAGIFKELTQNATFHDPDAELLMGMFDKSLAQINATISDLSEIVKVQKNINANREEVVLQELVEEVNLSIKEMIQTAGAVIHTDFTQVTTLTFSRVNLRSIFYNLLSNAVKYRSPHRTPEIYLKTARQEEYIVVTISDNGMGMDMKKHGSKMFQMFKRFHNHVSGSGLGLYIVNRILEKNEGYIEVQSQVNQGTTFTVYFKEPAKQ